MSQTKLQYQEFQSKAKDFPIIWTILEAVKEISYILQHTPVIKLESANKFGDQQLNQDVLTDQLVEKLLRSNPEVKGFASQERPEYHSIGEGEGYVVTYDPLDGSSIIDTNFSVGSIFSIWPTSKDNLIGTKIGEQVNAILAVYGPRTTAVFYNSQQDRVQEVSLVEGKWILTYDHLTIKPKTNMYCPGNLRAASEDEQYKKVVLSWINRGFTLRYTGGLVPDAFQILIKGHGIFLNIGSKTHKCKLRVLYEIAAVAFLFHKAGGKTITLGKKSLLDVQIKSFDDKLSFGAGSAEEVEMVSQIF